MKKKGRRKNANRHHIYIGEFIQSERARLKMSQGDFSYYLSTNAEIFGNMVISNAELGNSALSDQKMELLKRKYRSKSDWLDWINGDVPSTLLAAKLDEIEYNEVSAFITYIVARRK